MGTLDPQEIAIKLAWAILVLPFLASLVIALGMMWSRYARFSVWVSIAAMLTSAGCALVVLIFRASDPSASAWTSSIDWVVAGPLQLQMGVLVDNLSATMLFMVTLIASLIQIYSTVYMEHEIATDYGRFFAYMSIFGASMLMLVLAPNFVQLYIGWELVGLCSYLLIGFWWFKKSAADANKKAFIVNRVGDAGMLLGILYLFQKTGALYFTGPGNPLQTIYEGCQHGVFDHKVAAVIAVLIFCGAIGKSAQFPLHIWLPDAMEGPTPVSALIHAATMVAAGVYLVARCYPLFQATHTAMLVVASVGAFTSFMAATMGIAASDIKRVLAYSTCSQLGYMMLALGVGGSGLTAGTFHLVMHAFFKAMLFLGAGSVIHAMHTNDMWQMGGLGKYMKGTGTTFLIGCLAISGIPPFSGFFSKDAIVDAVVEYGNPLLSAAAILVAIMTAFYMFRLYFVTFCGEYRGFQPVHPISGETIDTKPHSAVEHGSGGDAHGHAEEHGHPAAAGHHEDLDAVKNYYEHEAHRPEGTPKENPAFMVLPLVVLAAFATFGGLVQNPGVLFHTQFFSDLVSPDSMFHYMLAYGPHAAEAGGPNWSVIGTSTTCALVGIFLAWLLYRSGDPVKTEVAARQRFKLIYQFLDRRWYMDDLWTGIAGVLMFDFGAYANWFDVNVINGTVNQVGTAVWEAAAKFREEQTGMVQQYATIIVIALLFFIIGVGVVGQDLLAPGAWSHIFHPPMP